jgi:hypothetical protein
VKLLVVLIHVTQTRRGRSANETVRLKLGGDVNTATGLLVCLIQVLGVIVVNTHSDESSNVRGTL